MTKSIGASKMSRVVGSFSQTYMPRNFPSIVSALALIATKDPTTSTATLRSCVFSIEELHEDLAAPQHANQQHSAIDPGSGSTWRESGCPFLAQSRRELVRCTCPLLGVKRT